MRPTQTITTKSGAAVELYTYFTVREKSEILRKLGGMDLEKPTTTDLLTLQELCFDALKVDENLSIDDLPAEDGDVLFSHAIDKFNPDPKE